MENKNVFLGLADLKDFTEEMVIDHLANNYSGSKSGFDYGEISAQDVDNAKLLLEDFNVLIAYESVGDWGCDSSSFFLLKRKSDGLLFEIHGSHCSCYGFEGQLDLEETSIEALKYRAEKADVFYAGGYDYNETENQRIINEYVLSI